MMVQTSNAKKTRAPYKSAILASVHETAQDLRDAGVTNRATLEKFDQSVFALYLNVTPGLVSQWERGEKHPAGASLMLLSLVEKMGLVAVG